MPGVRLVDANSILKKLKSELDGIQRETNYPIGISDGLSFAMATIDTAPTVDAQPVKHGEWIVPKNDDEQPYCSVCNWHAYGDLFTDYCPGCGSYMVGD